MKRCRFGLPGLTRVEYKRYDVAWAIAKRCRLDKWIRQRFAFALRFSRWFCDDKTSRFAYVEPSVDRYAYVEQLYLLLVVSRKEKLEKMDSAVEVFSNDDVITISNVNSNMQQYSAMMTSALL
ncbi:hypothetical protein F511_28748 [Dorcoceras hygrometricum]|uniref:Uncharacterized protein n=1 Tax=Dorcoceras hygrometricum TaxID=472368 RepID=A0A2Z7BYW6_9LAMI|nr:hypothetical protein F511_28748 [Dorcoceras hygrometricum]